MQGVVGQFSEDEKSLITALAHRLTGSSTGVQPKLESSLVNISRRMHSTQSATLREYLAFVESSPDEAAQLISALTIHTTSWFRERPHYDRLKNLAMDAIRAFKSGARTGPFRVLSAGCSSGEEAYSIALVLESLRNQHPEFDYAVEGWDVDPVSVQKANRAIYANAGKNEITQEWHRYLLFGSGKTEGYFTLDKSIRERTRFIRRSLIDEKTPQTAQFDLIFCRNVMIYFTPEVVRNIVRFLIGNLVPGGHICLGHSEGIDAGTFGVSALGNTTYKKSVDAPAVDDPRKQNVTRSSQREAIRADIILIGASTGGTEVLVKLLKDLPQPCPPVVVVQHISQSFARSFAERLAKASGLTLGDPTPGMMLRDNNLYMSLGDYHIGVKRRGGAFFIDTSRGAEQHGVRPAVDYLFKSVAQAASQTSVVAILLTGMGKDGAKGMRDLFDQGAYTIAQDEASCTVFGMPREAILLGAAKFIGNPGEIREILVTTVRRSAAA